MFQDLRFAFRTLRKRPGSTTVAVLMLALGIGANTVVFSLAQAFLLRPLDYENADELVRLYTTQEVAGGDKMRVTPGAFFDWRRRAGAFESLVAAQNMGLSVTDSERPLNPRMRRVSEGYFEALGVEPRMGRTLTPEEIREDARVAVLAFGFWQSYFGGDPEILGGTIELAGEAYEIVGILPAGFRNPAINPGPPVLWLPLAEPPEPNRKFGNLVVFGHLADGVSLDAAAAEMAELSAELAELYPRTDAGRGVRVLRLRESLVEDYRPALLALFGAVGFVLLLACANVANLLLARAVGRRQEIGVRLALGARRRHLTRQLLTESLLLGFCAAGLGLLMAFWSVGPLPGLAPSNVNVPLLEEVTLDSQAVVFTVGLALLTSVAFGLLPLWQALRAHGTVLKSGNRGGQERGRHRVRSALVIAEVAVSLVLLIGAGLMIRTFVALRSLDLGFEPEGLLTVRTTARGPYGTPARFSEFHHRVLEELRRLPGVEDAGACEILPMFASFRPSLAAAAPDRDRGTEETLPRAIPLRASVGFFRAVGMPLLSGRGFTDQDRSDSEPVAVVSQSLARRVWGDEDAVGRELALGADGDRRVRVVGVAADLRGTVQAPEPPPVLFVPEVQDPTQSMSFFLRTKRDPWALQEEAEQAILGVSRDVPVFLKTTMEQLIRDVEFRPRFVMELLAGFAAFALFLAATGIFAVLSYAVGERTREIGIRLAVGAARADVVRMVLAGALRLTALGLTLGLVAAVGLSRFLAGQLYGVEAVDPLTYAVLGLGLASVVAAASSLPAWKATRIDPVEALRCE